MDYDLTEIPAAYDRGREHGPALLDQWMDVVGFHLGTRTIARVLDLGCGTGRFSNSLFVRFDADVIGLDPSRKMLAEARAKPHARRVRYARGTAEALPLRAASIDLVFISMSLHHFTDAALAARECRRVIREAGSVVVRAGTREQIAAYPYVPFFPTARPMIERMLLDREGVRSLFDGAGFQLAVSDLVRQTIAPNWTAYLEKLATRSDSVLAQLSRQEFEAGLAAVRRHAATARTEPIVEPIDLFVFHQRH
jgi:ubiquinone/menaquinone biosynthesis C-methylase UbiE